jgi:hypothetical protein
MTKSSSFAVFLRVIRREIPENHDPGLGIAIGAPTGFPFLDLSHTRG